jgi:hypothetical protein
MTVTASAIAGGDRSAIAAVASLPGFVESTFSPLVYAAATRCLDEDNARDGDAPEPAELDAGTAVVLASIFGDTTTADVASQRMVSGRVHNPLLFYQSVPSAVLGYLSRERRIIGPMSCISPVGSLVDALFDTADLLCFEWDVRRVLLIGVELVANVRTHAVSAQSTDPWIEGALPAGDTAVALMVRPPLTVPLARSLSGVTPGDMGSLGELAKLAREHRHASDSKGRDST